MASQAQAATAADEEPTVGFSNVAFGGLTKSEKENIQKAAIADSDDAELQAAKKKIDAADKAQQDQMKTAFYDALTKKQRKQFDEAAKDQFEVFIKDQNQITEFGKESVEKVNQVVDQLIDAQKNVKIPAVDELLVQANRDLDGYVAKYKDEIQEEKTPSKFFQWFKNTKRKAQDAAYERQSLEKKLDILDGKVNAKREDLKSSFFLIRQLLVTNKASTNELVGVLAALEATHKVAVEQAQIAREHLAKATPNTPKWQEWTDRLADIAEVSNAIEAQHANYMARLAVAWATNSQVRNLLRTQSTVVRNLSMVHVHTIPMMKLSISQIGAITKVKDASKTTESLKEANSHALAVLSDLSENVLPDIEQKAQSPIINAEDVNHLTDSVLNSNTKIVDAIKQGRQARLALENAVRDAGVKIQESDKIRDEELVKALLNEEDENRMITSDFEKAAADAYTGLDTLAQ